MKKFLFAVSTIFLLAAVVLGFVAFTSVQSHTLSSYKAKNTPLIVSKKVDGNFTYMSLDERQTVINAYQDFTFDTIYSNSSSFSVSYGKPKAGTSDTSAYFRDFSFSGCMGINEDILKRHGYSIAHGSLPQKDNQVCITQYTFETYKAADYIGEDNNPVVINRYADIIGKKIAIGDLELEICGVIDTKLDRKFDILKKDGDSQKFLNSIKFVEYAALLPDIILNSPHTALFISEYTSQDLFEMPYIECQFNSGIINQIAAAISYGYAEVRQPQIVWADGKDTLDTGDVIIDKQIFRTLMLSKYGGLIFSEKFNGLNYNESTLTDDVLLQMLNSNQTLSSYIAPLNFNLNVVGIWDNGQSLNNYGCIISDSRYSAIADSATPPEVRVVSLVTPQQKKAAQNAPLFSQSVGLEDGGSAAIVPYVSNKIISLQRTILLVCFFVSIVAAVLTAVLAARKRS